MSRKIALRSAVGWAWIAVLSAHTACSVNDDDLLRTDASVIDQGDGGPSVKPDTAVIDPVAECADDRPCPATGNDCVKASCVQGQCVPAPVEDGTVCDDRLVCTTLDACTAGVCGGEPMACDDGLKCSPDACSETMGGCVADTSACVCDAHADCDDNNKCNGLETCDFTINKCMAGKRVDCSGINDSCNASRCEPATGACMAVPKMDGITCADGDMCTRADACQMGVCVGADPAQCAAMDQCHRAGICAPATGVCSNPPRPNGVTCNDGNACTNGEACQSGACAGGSQKSCVAMDECHAPGVCAPATGTCTTPERPDGTGCNDTLVCTQTDVCQAGVCRGTAQACSDGVACTADSCSEQFGGCVADPAACACQNDAACDDGNACNGRETCNQGTLTCRAGTRVDCSGMNSACQIGSCNPTSGACFAVVRQNGTMCNDGNLCTRSDSCQAGTCTGANPVTCAASDQCHQAGTCSPSTGVCSNPPAANGTSCEDGNACTQTDSCQTGACVGANPVACMALNQCHTAGTCDPANGRCSDPQKPNDTACSDGNACTQTDTCQTGVCNGSNPVTCTPLDQCHTAGVCAPATGVCTAPLKADGAVCNDGNLCTRTDSCAAGTCTGGNAVVCAAMDQCHTAGSCVPGTGMCTNPAKPNGDTCNDGNLCTQSDSCQIGACTGANPVVCLASDQCHVAGTCAPATGVCSNPNQVNGTACADGSVHCTSGDTCQSGVCAGTAVLCNDGIQCTVDSCNDAQNGCVVNTSACGCTTNAQCNDNNACNGVETCNLATLQCASGTPVSCTAFDGQCTTGQCAPATGACSSAPKTLGTPCNDGSLCTQADACNAGGACVGANPVVCAPLGQCYDTGTCAPGTGLCSNPPKSGSASCNDNNACTQTDTCNGAGACAGSNPVLCAAMDQCHLAGTCDTGTGVCSQPAKPNGDTCSDGNFCTQTDTCQSGACLGANPVSCAASDQCHDVGTCAPGTGVCSDPPLTGIACSDGSMCTSGDICQSGTCQPGTATTCPTPDQCHDPGVCNPGTGVCSNPPKTGSCSDGSACTVGDTCQTGACTPGPAVVCVASDQCHVVGVCDAGTGVCSSPAAMDGTTCTDGNLCTLADSCQGGTCVSTMSKTCPVPGVCHTTASCDPMNGLCNDPLANNGTLCNDGLLCTNPDACTGGACGGTPAACTTPTNQCKVAGTCIEGNGCVDGNQPDGTPCTHASACIINEACATGACTGASRKNANGDWNLTPGPFEGTGILSVQQNHTPNGEVMLAGVFGGTVNFGAVQLAVTGTEKGAYYTRYSEAGSVINAQRVIHVSGSIRASALVIRDLTVRMDSSFVLVGEAMGDSIVFGATGTTLNVPMAALTMFVASFDKDGVVEWVRQGVGADVSGRAAGVFKDGGGTLMIAGHVTETITLEGCPVGFKDLTGPGTFVAYYDRNGVCAWAYVVANKKLTRLKIAMHSDLHRGGLIGGFDQTVTLSSADGTGPSFTAVGLTDVTAFVLDDQGRLVSSHAMGGQLDDQVGGIAPLDGFAVLVGIAGDTGLIKGTGFADPTGLRAIGKTVMQAHLLLFNPAGTLSSASYVGEKTGTDPVGVWDLASDRVTGDLTMLGTFLTAATTFENVGTGSGLPINERLTITNAKQNTALFAARFRGATSEWAVGLRGASAGIGSGTDWDAQIIVHQPSEAATAAGMFNAAAEFGDAKVDTITPAGAQSLFLSHFNAQAEYDYCP